MRTPATKTCGFHATFFLDAPGTIRRTTSYLQIDLQSRFSILAVSFAVLWLSLASLSAEQSGPFTYEVSGEVVTIVGYSSSESDRVEIPSSIEGLPVTAIGAQAFEYRRLRSVVIPEGVTSIGYAAFAGCDSLFGVTIPASVTSIGHSAFAGCSLLFSVTIPEGVTTIGGGAFGGCSRLTSVTIPGSVTTIGNGAFGGCSGLTSVTIREGVTSIGDGAFSECHNLSSVVIPARVTSIGHSTFYNCWDLASVTIPEGVVRIADGAFYGCIGLTSVLIPESVTSIGHGAFGGCWRLTSMTIPEGVTSIGNQAFGGCRGLTSVTIPEGVTSIGNRAFSGCTGLTTVTIPEGVNTISDEAFSGCSGLTSLVIPENVTSIGNEAFSGCTSLAGVSLGRGLLSIGWNAFLETATPFQEQDGLLYLTSPTAAFLVDGRSATGDMILPDTFNGLPLRSVNAFRGCENLTSLTIPASVSSIDSHAFDESTNLRAIYVDEANPNYADHDGALIDLETNTLLRCPEGKAGTYTIPEGVTRIADYAFHPCRRLTSVTIPEGVASIGNRAFLGCRGLTTVTIPGSVTSIGSSAFSIGPELTSLVFMGDAPSDYGFSPFGYSRSSLTIYYLAGRAGFTASPISRFPTIEIDLAATPAATWLIENGLPHDANLDQDLNRDGVNLLMAYALNFDPNQNLRQHLPVPVVDGSTLTMTFHGTTPGITYIVETSTDLQNWTATGVTMGEPDLDGLVTASVERDEAQGFLRLVVSG